jgi:hypothetical protein
MSAPENPVYTKGSTLALSRLVVVVVVVVVVGDDENTAFFERDGILVCREATPADP